MEVKILNPRLGVDFPLPEFATKGSAGLDLRAMVDEPVDIYPGEVKLIPTGIALDIYYKDRAGLIMPRSGLGHKKGLILGNGVGLIDSDYHGELRVSAWNRKDEGIITVHPGDRFAQIIFLQIYKPLEFQFVEEFSRDSERGEGGFGHTGVK